MVEQCVNHQNDHFWGRNVFVEGRRVSRRQNPTSVMVCAAVTATGRVPLVFVPSGVKLNSQRYISDILEGELLPWVREHLEGALCTFQQDSAPSHGSRMSFQLVAFTIERSILNWKFVLLEINIHLIYNWNQYYYVNGNRTHWRFDKIANNFHYVIILRVIKSVNKIKYIA